MNKSLFFASAAFLATLFLPITGWSQTILSYNFTGFNNADPPAQLSQVESGDTLGVVPASGWVNFNIPSGDSAEVFTDGDITLTASDVSGGGGARSVQIVADETDPDTEMLGAGWAVGGSTTFTVAGLSANPKNIYLYLGANSTVGARNNDLRLTGTTFGSTTYFATLDQGGGAGDGPTTNDGTDGFPGVGYVRVDSTDSNERVDGNYVLWEGVTDTSFTIDFPASSFLSVTGMQVEVIPEPSAGTLIMLSVGVLALIRRRRK